MKTLPRRESRYDVALVAPFTRLFILDSLACLAVENLGCWMAGGVVGCGMPELSVEAVRAVLSGGGWRVSEPVGSMRRTRIARREGRAVVVKLTDVAGIVARLAGIGVAPAVVEAGDGYVVQEYVEGPHPDHAWFAAQLRPWPTWWRGISAMPSLRLWWTARLAGSG